MATTLKIQQKIFKAFIKHELAYERNYEHPVYSNKKEKNVPLIIDYEKEFIQPNTEALSSEEAKNINIIDHHREKYEALEFLQQRLTDYGLYDFGSLSEAAFKEIKEAIQARYPKSLEPNPNPEVMESIGNWLLKKLAAIIKIVSKGTSDYMKKTNTERILDSIEEHTSEYGLQNLEDSECEYSISKSSSSSSIWSFNENLPENMGKVTEDNSNGKLATITETNNENGSKIPTLGSTSQ